MEKRVFVRNGSNAYKVIKSGHKYIVSVDKGIFFNHWSTVGEADTLEDALVLIKVHSGKEIREIKDV